MGARMTSWWNKNVQLRIDEFKSWVGDFNQPSKIYCRQHIAKNKYKSIIDCGCGLASDYYGFLDDQYDIEYTGLDSCDFFVDDNRNRGITMVKSELEADLDIPDSSYECVYSREVLEHLSYYEKSLSEFIRIGSKEVLIVFFIYPCAGDDQINYWEAEDLYHNVYGKEKLEGFILSNPKVKNIMWSDVNDLGYVPKRQPDPVPELVPEPALENADDVVEIGSESPDTATVETLVEAPVETAAPTVVEAPVPIVTVTDDSSTVDDTSLVQMPTTGKYILHILLKAPHEIL